MLTKMTPYPIKVEMYCEECIDSHSERGEDNQMKLDGFLLINPQTKTQSQKYICPICHKRILITIDVLLGQLKG